MPTVTIGTNAIHYVEAGRGYPLVLIHGLAGDHQAWTPQIDALSRDYRVIAFDNRGAGRSTQRDAPVSTRDLAQDTLALMDHLRLPQAIVIGRSMGGAIAQHMALVAPERIAGMVLCASFAKLDPLGRRVLTNMREVLQWTGRWEDHARHSVQNFVSAAFYNDNPEAIARIEKIIASESRLPACYIRQNHACLEHDTLSSLPSIRCPVLVLGGGRDPICSPTATRWLGEGLPNAETVLFENSSHFFLLEEPARFMKTVSEWLNNRTPEGLGR